MTPDDTSTMDTVAVVGAGEMGRGIAAVAALHGRRTLLQDIDEDQLATAVEYIEDSYEKVGVDVDTDAALERLETVSGIDRAVADADLAIEAVVEQQSVKAEVFESLDAHAPADAILATNTSGLNVTRLAERTDRPSQVVGLHWFNPPMLMDLVEVVLTEHTDESVAGTCESFVEAVDKTPIRCRRDVPLFIVNRCMRPYAEAAAWLVYHDIADVREVDAAMKHREGFPMGPFELCDFTGSIQITVESEDDHLEDNRPLSIDTRSCPLFHDLYERGRYGRKADAGFYDYGGDSGPEVPPEAGLGFDTLQVWAPIINEAARMVEHDVATAEDIDTGMRLGGNWPVGPLEKADEVGLESVVRVCVETAERHRRFNKAAEVIPCRLLVEKAKAGETFH